MRIRKNAKLSSMLLATSGYEGEMPETYICHLNQSPWDVIPVSSSSDAELTNLLDSSWFIPSPSYSSPPLIPLSNGDEDSSNGNDSSGFTTQRFNSPSERFASVERFDLNVADNYEVEEPMDLSYNNNDKKPKSMKTTGDEVTIPAPPKRGRPRGTKTKKATEPSNNPYEFYYYSGFGPRWGRKRGSSCDDNVAMCESEKSCEKKGSGSDEGDFKTAAFEGGSCSFDGFEEDCEFMDGESDDHEKKNKREKTMMTSSKKMKKGRKPVKERSLKSLM